MLKYKIKDSSTDFNLGRDMWYWGPEYSSISPKIIAKLTDVGICDVYKTVWKCIF